MLPKPTRLGALISSRRPPPAGSLPTAWSALGAFKKLNTVSLQDNPGLTGTIPRSWGWPRRLTSLYLL